MTYMTSNSSNDGTMTLNVFFKQGTDPDNASVNVQNRVSKAMSQLPQEVTQSGISTQKVQNSLLCSWDYTVKILNNMMSFSFKIT
jgi:multidrug efflux pump subunit AcrB